MTELNKSVVRLAAVMVTSSLLITVSMFMPDKASLSDGLSVEKRIASLIADMTIEKMLVIKSAAL